MVVEIYRWVFRAMVLAAFGDLISWWRSNLLLPIKTPNLFPTPKVNYFYRPSLVLDTSLNSLPFPLKDDFPLMLFVR